MFGASKYLKYRKTKYTKLNIKDISKILPGRSYLASLRKNKFAFEIRQNSVKLTILYASRFGANDSRSGRLSLYITFYKCRNLS